VWTSSTTFQVLNPPISSRALRGRSHLNRRRRPRCPVFAGLHDVVENLVGVAERISGRHHEILLGLDKGDAGIRK